MADAKDTLFTSGLGAAGDASDYLRDVFSDVSLPATNNSGLTSTASTNPFGDFFANDDATTYGVKTLFIKDATLIEDRSKWINDKPTYRIIWNETFPAAKGYLFGNIQTSVQAGLASKAVFDNLDGFGVVGKIRRVTWIVDGSAAATNTAQQALDGVNTTTISFSAIAGDAPVYRQHSTTNETNDLHDFRLTAIQVGNLKALGVQVYYENSGTNVNQDPGVTYVDKSKITTTTGATFALPAYGSSLGGHALAYKTSSSGYALSAIGASSVTSVAQGSSGTNLLTVSTGHGASFPAGTGFVVPQGTSMYVGVVRSVSTDTLTVSPTLPFGLTNLIYSMWHAGPTYAISSTFFQLSKTLDLSTLFGGSAAQIDPEGKYNVWSSNIGLSSANGVNAAFFNGASGFINIGGYFCAAEIETNGATTVNILNATMCIDGLPAWSINTGLTAGITRRTVFTDGGPGWHQISIQPGTSMGGIGFSRVTLYNRKDDVGVTFGRLAGFDTLQTYTERFAVNSTMIALGTYRRVFSDQLPFLGSWVRGVTLSAAGGALYYGASTNSNITYEFYGKNFAFVGTAASAATMTIDGVGTPNTFNSMISVATEGFHKVSYTVGAGATAQIEAFDYARTKAELVSDQIVQETAVTPVPQTTKQPTVFRALSGAGTYFPPAGVKSIMVWAVGGAGGGAGSSTSAGANGGNGVAGTDTVFGPPGFITAAGGGLATGNGAQVGGLGGAASINANLIGVAVNGGSGAASTLVAGGSFAAGGTGGSSAFGGGGSGGAGSGASTGLPGAANSGGGGGGAASPINGYSGPGGGAGGYVMVRITNPLPSYPYSVGAGGAGGIAGTGGQAGGAGGSGVLLIEESYQ